MGMWDENGKFFYKRLIKYGHDLLLVQALRKGIDVPIEKLEQVENLGEIMVTLDNAEKTLEASHD